MLSKVHLVVVASILAIAVPIPSLRIRSTQLEAGPERQLSRGTLKILLERSGHAQSVRVATEMMRVETTATFNDTAVVLGSNPYLDEAVIVCGASMKAQRAIGYSMELLGDWLVGIEFSPNHLAPYQSSTDVVLVRKLGGDSCKSTAPLGETESALVKAAGHPVYPAENRTKQSYQNIFEGDVETVAVFPRTFVRLSGHRLAFVAARFRGGSRGSPFVVVVQVSLQGGPPKEYSLEGAATSLGLPSARGLEVVGAELAGKNGIRIKLQKGAYKMDTIVIPLD